MLWVVLNATFKVTSYLFFINWLIQLVYMVVIEPGNALSFTIIVSNWFIEITVS